MFLIIFLINIFTVSASQGAYVNLNATGTAYGYELLWKMPYTGYFDEFGSVVIENGVGYVVGKAISGFNGTENITAFNATDGSMIWSRYIDDSDGAPLIDNQGNYVWINTNGLNYGIYKLNKTNGSILCENHQGGSQQSLAQSNNLIFEPGRYSNNLTAYNKNDCLVNWSYAVPDARQIPTTPLYWEDTVTFGTYNMTNHFVQLNATTGTLIWNNTNLGYTWDMQPSVKDGVIYMGSTPSPGIGAFNFSTGVLIWNRTDIGGFLSQMAIYNNRLWAGGGNKTIYSLNLNDGTTNCTSYNTGGNIFQGPSIVQDNDGNGYVFFGSLGNFISMINATDCSLIWNYDVGADIYSAPAIAKGNIYFAADDYNVWAFDLGNGTGEWSYLGYNSSGQSYCSDCLTSMEYIKVNCTQGSNITCTVKNYYDHTISNITLNVSNGGFNYNWYNSSNDLVKSNSLNYALDLASSATETLTLVVINDTGVNLINITDEGNFTHLDISTSAPYDSLIGYWNFDGDKVNTTLTKTYDWSKYNNDGTGYNVTVNDTNCLYGNCANFNGVNSYINCGNSTVLDLNNSITLSTWIRFVDTTYGTIVSSKVNTGYELLKTNTNTIRFRINNSLSSAVSSTLGNNTWYYIVATYNGSDLKIYVNGILNVTTSGIYSDPLLASTGLQIGFNPGGSNYFKGSIDEVMIFNSTLNSSQILAIYNNQSSRFVNQGKYELYNQTYINITSGNNRVNITSNTLAFQGSSINLTIGYYDGNWAYTNPQVISSGVVQTFNISSISTNLTLNYTFYAGNSTNPFYSPIITNNITFNYWYFDTSAPVISLVSPVDLASSTSTSTSWEFIFNVSDISATNCSLILDGSMINFNSSVNISGGATSFTNSSSVGSHSWSVNCTDINGNTGNSSSRTFSITSSSTPSSSGGSGYPTFNLAQEQIEKGIEKVLYKNWGVSFALGNESHKIKVDEIKNNSATITISSSPITLTLFLGEEKKVNLNNDNFYDLYLKLNLIKNSYANLTIKSIYEEIPAEKEEVKEEVAEKEDIEIKEEPKLWLWLALGLIIVIAIILIVRYKSKKR